MKNKKTEIEIKLGKFYTQLTGKKWQNTTKQHEEFSKFTDNSLYPEVKKLVIQLLKINFS